MAVLQWRKLWRDVNRDPKFTTLKPVERTVFLQLLPELEDDGSLPPVAGVKVANLVADLVHVSTRAASKALAVLALRGLLSLNENSLKVTRFEERQQGKERAPAAEESVEKSTALTNAQRQRRYREQRNGVTKTVTETVTNSVTPAVTCNDESNVTETQEERREKKEVRVGESNVTLVTETVTQPTPPTETPTPTPTPRAEPVESEEMRCARIAADAVEKFSRGVLTKMTLTTADYYKLGVIAKELKDKHGIQSDSWVKFAKWIAPSGPGLKQVAGKPFTPSWNRLLVNDGAWVRDCIKQAIDWDKKKGASEYNGRC